MHVFITANSPGEIAGWVKPLAIRLKEKNPRVKVSLVICPCQYASGREIMVAREWPWIDEIVDPRALLKYVLLGRQTFSWNFEEKSCILFLGGDPFYAAILSRRMKIPAFAYTERPGWEKYFKKFLVSNSKAKEKLIHSGVESKKIEVVGYLALDSIDLDQKEEDIYNTLGFRPGDLIIGFLPGSRPVEINFMLPFFLQSVDLIRKKIPDARFLFALSPFSRLEDVKKILSKHEMQAIRQSGFTEVETSSKSKVILVEKNPHQVIKISRLLVTVPGTNNLQIAGLGKPMLVVLPLNRAELIPMDGIIGLINPKIPPVGFIKKQLIFKKNKMLRFISLPNKAADQMVVPELRGIISPQDVADKVLSLLETPGLLHRISEKLKNIPFERGAAERIASILLNS